VAEVCAAALEAAGMVTTTKDCMALLGRVNSAVAERAYRMLLSRPAIYDAFHFGLLRAEGRFSKRGDRAACRRIVSALSGELSDPMLELVLSVFATGAAVGGELAERRLGLRNVVFCTDATVHAMWVDDRTDLFVATSELAARTVRRYRPAAEVAVIPAPVRPAFYDAPSPEAARAVFGLDGDRPCVLLVAGGWGVAPLAESARELAAAGYHVLAVAGSNRKLWGQLCSEAASNSAVRAFAYVEDMVTLVAASDVVVSGPGQTCNEVRVVGRPLVVLDAVPGHGRENLLYELMQGGAASASPQPGSVRRAVDAVLKSDPPPPSWPVRDQGEWRRHFLAALAPLGLSLSTP
jgi:processive 1,2-diacylglycerol beta-glucosyltransferase